MLQLPCVSCSIFQCQTVQEKIVFGYNHLAHSHAARYCNTLSCTCAASETGSPASGIPSAITLKPAFANPVGVKRTFSSTNDTISSKPKMPTSSAEWEAKWASDKATMEADHAAWSAKMDA
ncbi:hypothetical protein C2845_PM13G25880 [Panicum miliaceum]|uniref:Uncharacterized protein n=1 Tax=Panicum miliaceum TaxID=4540 RepID=A0A3L6RHM7_PANMI|nr:hypothetical protein C2845_PM13G25880 [Panicum miliaceum]